MRTIKLLILLLGGLFLITSCYTQLALVEREVYENDDYYYPPSDTIYSDESPVIVQNFYNDVPYDFDFGMHIGFYDDWWLWSDWYYPYAPYWRIGFYPIRPYRPWLVYPGLIVYDPFYWDYYYDYWYWDRGPVHGMPYGPRPFAKGGSLLRGGGSKRVRISQTPGNDHGVGSSTFLPTRTTGSVISSSDSRKSIRKTTGSTTIRKTTRDAERITKSSRTVVRKGTTERSTKRKSTVTRTKTRTGRKYYPITTIRSTKPKTTVKQPKATSRKLIKTQSRSTKKSYGTSRSTYTTKRSSSVSRPSYSSPSRSSSRSSSTIRSTSSSSRSSSRSATRSSSSRSSRSRK